MLNTVRPEDIIDSEFVNRFLLPKPPVMLSDVERQCILSLARKYLQGCGGFEIGTWRGYTTAMLAKAFPEESFVTVDYPQPNHPKYPQFLPQDEIGIECKQLENVEQIYQDSSTLTLENFPEGTTFDFAFIDGCHEINYIIHDYKLAFDLTTSRGIIIFDDFCIDYVKEINRGNHKKFSNGDVSLFIKEYRDVNDWYYIEGTKLVYMIGI